MTPIMVDLSFPNAVLTAILKLIFERSSLRSQKE